MEELVKGLLGLREYGVLKLPVFLLKQTVYSNSCVNRSESETMVIPGLRA